MLWSKIYLLIKVAGLLGAAFVVLFIVYGVYVMWRFVKRKDRRDWIDT
jgi:predicted membrane protein